MRDPGLKAYRRDTRANITIIAALCMLSIMLSLAVAIDSAAQLNSRKLMQSALDSASLSGAKAFASGSHTDEEVNAIVANAFRSNMLTGRSDLTCGAPTTGLDDETGDVSVSAKCSFPAMLGGSLTRDTIDISVSSTARSARTKVDVAMVLDVSRSMHGTRLEALKTAAKDAAETMVTARAAGDIRVSAVSYGTAVNAGKYGRYAWGEDIDLDDEGLWWMPGCVSERVGDGAWDDRAPGDGAWVTQAQTCPGSQILPLTSDLDAFDANIDGLRAAGSTAGHLGIAWAWYLISPNWSDIWPAASKPRADDEADVVKVVIVMTDGAFNMSYHSPYGSSRVQAEKLCEEMRNKGIIIYSVAFNAPSDGQETLKTCAGYPTRYFEASTDTELASAYENIALLLTSLRLVR